MMRRQIARFGLGTKMFSDGVRSCDVKHAERLCQAFYGRFGNRFGVQTFSTPNCLGAKNAPRRRVARASAFGNAILKHFATAWNLTAAREWPRAGVRA